MNKKHLSAALIAAFIAAICLPVPRLSAQLAEEDLPAEKSPDKKSKDPVVLIISYGAGPEARFESHRGVVEPISLHVNRLMPFSLQFPSDKVRMPVAVGSLDGGEVIGMASVTDLRVSGDGEFVFNYQPANQLFVDQNGIVRLGFQSGAQRGLYRVVVQLPGEQHLLQFYVTDPAQQVETFWHH